MDEAARLRKKAREMDMLRDLTPQETLKMGLEMMTFARRLAEAADRADR